MSVLLQQRGKIVSRVQCGRQSGGDKQGKVSPVAKLRVEVLSLDQEDALGYVSIRCVDACGG